MGGAVPSQGCLPRTGWTSQATPWKTLGKAPPAKTSLDCQCGPLVGQQLPADWTDFSPASTLSCCIHEWLTGTDMQRTLRAEFLYLTADRLNFFLLDFFFFIGWFFWSTVRAVILTVVNAWPTQFKRLFQVVCGSLSSSSCDQPGGCTEPLCNLPVFPFVNVTVCWQSALIMQRDRQEFSLLKSCSLNDKGNEWFRSAHFTR